jgi:hypothetical protein
MLTNGEQIERRFEQPSQSDSLGSRGLYML